MADPSANGKIHLALGIQSGLKQLTIITLGFASGNSQLFPALLNPSSQIVFPVALVISHYLYNVTTILLRHLQKTVVNGSDRSCSHLEDVKPCTVAHGLHPRN